MVNFGDLADRAANTVGGVVTAVVDTLSGTGSGSGSSTSADTTPLPTPDEVATWTQEIVDVLVTGTTTLGAHAEEQLNRLTDAASEAQTGALIFLQSVVAGATTPDAVERGIDFVMDRGLLSNREIIDLFAGVAEETQDWEQVLSGLASRRGNLDELLEAIEASGNAAYLVGCLMAVDATEAFQTRVLCIASRLETVFGLVVDVLTAPPYDITPTELLVRIFVTKNGLRRRTQQRLLALLDERELLDQHAVVDGLAAQGTRARALARAFFDALRTAGIAIVAKVRQNPVVRGAALLAELRAQIASGDLTVRKRAEFNLAAMRLALDTIVASANPTSGNALQQRAAEALSAALPGNALTDVRSTVEATLRPFLSSTGLGPTVGSTDELAEIGLSAGGPLSSLRQSLLENAEPDPWERVTPLMVTTDHAIEYPGTWNDSCRQRLGNGELPQDIADEMREYYGHGELRADRAKLLPQAGVEKIIVYNRMFRQSARTATTGDKRVVVKTLDRRHDASWFEQTIEMAVPLSDDRCLIDQADASGEQILAVDVSPAIRIDDPSAPGGFVEQWVNTVRVIGTGFMSEEVEVISTMRAWGAPDADGRLVANGVLQTSGLPATARAFQSPEIGKQEILLDWPATAALEGLYSVRFRFHNTSGLQAISPDGVSQDPTTCAIVGLTDVVETEELWFAVLPTPAAANVRPVVTRVECRELLNPPIWFDDIVLRTRLTCQRIGLGYDASGAPSVVPTESFPSLAGEGGRHTFLKAGAPHWEPEFNLLSPDSRDRHPLQLDELLSATIELWETEDHADRRVWQFIFTAILVVIGVMASMVATYVFAVIIIVIWIAAAAATAPTFGTVWLPAIGATMTAIAGWVAVMGLIWGALFAAGLVMVGVTTALIGGEEKVLDASPQWSGLELAYHTSPVRFHRALLPPLDVDPEVPEMISHDIVSGGIDSRFEEGSSSSGGLYRVRMRLDQ